MQRIAYIKGFLDMIFVKYSSVCKRGEEKKYYTQWNESSALKMSVVLDVIHYMWVNHKNLLFIEERCEKMNECNDFHTAMKIIFGFLFCGW